MFCLVPHSIAHAVSFPVAASVRARSVTSPADSAAWIDVNRVRLVVTNFGSFGTRYGPSYEPGLEYPAGSASYLLFAGGPWLAASVARSPGPRIALAEYASEFAPGPIAPAAPSPARRASLDRAYVLRREYASVEERDARLAEYVAGAVPAGAPAVRVNGDGTLDIFGDEMAWCVFNDADTSRHHSRGGSTPPLGVEVRQTTFAYDDAGALGDAVFLRYQLHNRGNQALLGATFGFWVDPDLGGPLDDMVGFDPARGLGFAYNGGAVDDVYGARTPALGVDVLKGPPLSAFTRYVGGDDPQSVAGTLAFMQGQHGDGSPVIDPATSLPTTFPLTGDPVAGTGWRDSVLTNKLMLLCDGPFDLAVGDSQEVLVALVAGQGADRLASITRLRANDDAIQSFADAGVFDVAGVHPPRGPVGEVALAPNPSTDRVQMTFRGVASAPARLDVFDLSGRLVRTESLPFATAAVRTVSFDMRGQRPGLYWVRITQGGATSRAKLVFAP